jgi:hypothetical protein
MCCLHDVNSLGHLAVPHSNNCWKDLTSYNHVIKLLHLDVIYIKTVQMYATFAHVHSVQQKSNGLIFRTSRSNSHVTYICNHNSSHFTFPIVLRIRGVSLSSIHSSHRAFKYFTPVFYILHSHSTFSSLRYLPIISAYAASCGSL